MTIIQADKLIALFKRMAREHWRYEWGAAKEGAVDCSGAFVYAFKKLAGLNLPHGSNALVREWGGEIAPAKQAQPGYMVTKWRAEFTGENADELRKKYGSDRLGDHYHIGLMGDDGLVYNAQSEKTGFVASDIKNWDYCLPIKKVAYSESGENVVALYKAIVTTENDPLNVRSAPKTGLKIGTVPRGATVEILSAPHPDSSALTAEDWPRIRFGELVGYASAAFLSPITDSAVEEGGGEAEETGGMIAVSREALLALADAAGAIEPDSAVFTDWLEKVREMQEAAEAVLAYLKGDD